MTRRQAGFTIIEFLVATTIGLIMLLVIGGVLVDNLRTADGVASRIAVNRHAREVFDLLAFGARSTGANATPIAFDHVFGLRGRLGSGAATSSGWSVPGAYMARDDGGTGSRRYRFALPFAGGAPDNTGDDEMLAERIESLDVSCTGTDLPLQGCAPSAQVSNVAGFLRADPDVSPANAVNGVRELTVQLIDPRRLNQLGAYQSYEYDTVWMAFWSLVTKVPTS